MTSSVDTVALLLADPSPALRYRALVELDGVSEHDAEVVAVRSEIARSRDVERVIAALDESGSDARVLTYALSRLAHLGLRRGDPIVDSLAERVFAIQHADGSWPTAGRAGGRGRGARAVAPEEGYRWLPVQTALPLRGLAAAGYASDPRSEQGYEWLMARRLADGSWPTGQVAGQRARVMGYRRLPRAEGCRASTTAVVAALAHHPDRRAAPEARIALDLLLQRETRDEWAIGFEIARLLGAEPLKGFITFYARFDLGFLLDLASRMGIAPDDSRIADLVAFLEGLRGPYGLWDHPSHPHLSRWLTLDLLAAVRRLEGGDWVGSDWRTPFRAYPKRRERY